MKRCLVAAVLTLSVAWTLPAQEEFKTRLSPVPIDAQLAPNITGHGSVAVFLTGSKLMVKGAFQDMHSPATAAHLYQSKMTGVRGVPIHDLMVTKAMAGAVSGSIDLAPQEVEALRKGLLYVVVNSEGAPDGNLWGWLLK